MSKRLCVVSVLFFCAVIFLHQPVMGAGELFISCSGTQSNGGGGNDYEYTLVNTGQVPVTLTLFYVGTMDLNVQDYMNWTAPAGFNAVATVADWVTLFNLFGTSVMGTTGVKTPHGVIPPQNAFASAGGIAWSGNLQLAPNQQVTFSFRNRYAPWDMEWFADHPVKPNTSQGFLYLPIAGPLGVFTQGFVHGPSLEPVPVEQSTFGRIKALFSTND